MHRLPLILAAAFALSAPARADVVSTGTNSFHIRHEVPLVVSAERAFPLLTRPADWWNGSHSYSGDAANLSIELQPGGCFCERWDDGFVRHLEVIAYSPGKDIVLSGGLGPLRDLPATGVMRWTVETSGTGGILTIDYKVTGFPESDAERWASAVDRVLADQALRFRTRAAELPRR